MSKPVIKHHVIDTVFLEQLKDPLRIFALKHLSIDRLTLGNIISGSPDEIRRAKEYLSTRNQDRVAGKSKLSRRIVVEATLVVWKLKMQKMLGRL